MKGPLVKDHPDAAAALQYVKLATIPLQAGNDLAWQVNTGWDRGTFPNIRARRTNPRKEQFTSGLLSKIRAVPAITKDRVAMKMAAFKFWQQKTSPLNLGCGKVSKVLSPCYNVFILTALH